MHKKNAPHHPKAIESAIHSAIVPDQHQGNQQVPALVILKDEARVDSRVLTLHFGKDHHDMYKLVKNYRADFEQLGVVRFQSEKPLPGSKGGRPERFALLNEDQAYLLLAYARNTKRVRSLKVKLIQAFRDARHAAELRQTEYLPEYHALHNQVAELAHGSANERFVHINFNRLVNKVAGIESGQRHRAPLSILSTVQAVATQAMAGATDHKDGYKRAQAALHHLAMLLPVAGVQALEVKP